MSWKRALEADARLAAKNSVLIRAALRQSVDFEAAFYGYQSTTPDLTLSLPQQRARARAWAMLNIRVNLEPFRGVWYRTLADAYVLGDLAAQEQVDEAREARKKVEAKINWETWKPGDKGAALLLNPPKAFQNLLQSQGITLKGFSDTTLKDLGNALGEAIELGLDAKTSAKNIMNHVASPARALSIAITEQNRAISEATKQRYLESGLEKMQWLVFDPCDICAKNENVEVVIGRPFPSGDEQPPAHPHCRCALAPVIPGFEEAPLPGATIIDTPPVEVVPEVVPVVPAPIPVPDNTVFVPGQWRELTRDEIKEEVINEYIKKNPAYYTREKIETAIKNGGMPPVEANLIKVGIVLKNGPIRAMFVDSGLKLNEKERSGLLKSIENLQTVAPKEAMTVVVTQTGKKRAYGSAILGDAKIFIKPDVAKDLNPLPKEIGFKMPMIAKVPHRDYTLTHEWGHSIDIGGRFGRTTSIQNRETMAKIKKLKKQYADVPDAFVSEYAQTNTKEFYAEMYAEWILTKGATANPLVRAMAKEFGWNKPKVVRSGVMADVLEQETTMTGYRGYHRAPSRLDDVGGPATDVETGLMPDFYKRPNIYTTGMPEADRESVEVLMSIRNKPDAMVTIYRAVPNNVKTINEGDWVTLSPSYAESHLASNVEGGHVISMRVPARDLWFDGNSINEFGYDPVKVGK